MELDNCPRCGKIIEIINGVWFCSCGATDESAW